MSAATNLPQQQDPRPSLIELIQTIPQEQALRLIRFLETVPDGTPPAAVEQLYLIWEGNNAEF